MTWHTLQLFRQRLGVLAGAHNAVVPQELFVLQLTLISGRRRHGKATGYEKIAAIPVRHIDNGTNVSHMFHIAHQNDFHRLSPSRTALLAERIASYLPCLYTFQGGRGRRPSRPKSTRSPNRP